MLCRKNVIVVDSSNEIAGDGDIPHHCIGNARRMQVPCKELQHQVMKEAVQNHCPDALIIDEIGTRLEAEAAKVSAQNGVILVWKRFDYSWFYTICIYRN